MRTALNAICRQLSQVQPQKGTLGGLSSPQAGGTTIIEGGGAGGGVVIPTNLFGDVTGMTNATIVGGIQGVPVSATTPSTGQLLIYNGTDWLASSLNLMAALTGTVNGSNTSFTLPFTPIVGVMIMADGVVWKQGTDYTLSGTSVTATIAPNQWITATGI